MTRQFAATQELAIFATPSTLISSQKVSDGYAKTSIYASQEVPLGYKE
jgi:hypothetical protein